MEDIKYVTNAITENVIDRLNEALILNDVNDIKYSIEMAICDIKRLNEYVDIHVKYNKVDNLYDSINGEI